MGFGRTFYPVFMDNEEILQSLEKARTGANENETRLLNQCYIRDNNTGYRNQWRI